VSKSLTIRQAGQEKGLAMFYHGGMTLGYFTPPAKPEKSIRIEKQSMRSNDSAVDVEPSRVEELSRAFLTPWHLFY
jgi:hypothetical protein